MWARDRYNRILSILSARGQVSNDLLIQELQVSRETIRRDVLELEAEGQLRRVHGGIVTIDIPPELPFHARMQSKAAEKYRIGVAAAKFIESGMLCAIDAGTTTSAFAAALAKVPDVSVVTNSMDVAAVIRRAQPGSEIILLGGRMNSDVPGTFGEQAIAAMRQFLPDVVILSPTAINATHGATNYHIAEVELARAMIGCSRKVILLSDHAKLGMMSRVQLCACDEIDVMITDRKADPEQLKALRDKGVGEIVLA